MKDNSKDWLRFMIIFNAVTSFITWQVLLFILLTSCGSVKPKPIHVNEFEKQDLKTLLRDIEK